MQKIREKDAAYRRNKRNNYSEEEKSKERESTVIANRIRRKNYSEEEKQRHKKRNTELQRI